jgi:DNA-binding MarR family transcriptional regulator
MGRAKSHSSKQRLAERLAQAFEQTMHQLTLLGHHLPKVAESMTPQQLRLLNVLAFAGEPLTMSTLSTRIGVTPGTLTEVAKRLVAAGQLQRERSKSDDRVVTLALTPEGEATVAAIRGRRVDLFRELCADLDVETCKTLIESHEFIANTYASVLSRRTEV